MFSFQHVFIARSDLKWPKNSSRDSGFHPSCFHVNSSYNNLPTSLLFREHNKSADEIGEKLGVAYVCLFVYCLLSGCIATKNKAHASIVFVKASASIVTWACIRKDFQHDVYLGRGKRLCLKSSIGETGNLKIKLVGRSGQFLEVETKKAIKEKPGPEKKIIL